MELYDLAIIGGGPAGLAAGIYAARAELKAVVIEKLTAGGQLATTSEIANYPGFDLPVDASELAQKMKSQAVNLGAEFMTKNVTGISIDENGNKVLSGRRGDILAARAVIFALGAEPKKLQVEGEDKFRGAGVSYCAVCDGAFFTGKTAVVVGGGDTAAADALYLSKMCSKVYLIHRRDSLRATKSYVTEINKRENIEIIWNSVVTSINGEMAVSSCSLLNVKTNEKSNLPCNAVFIAVGTSPVTGLAGQICKLDTNGFIIADETTQTSAEGVFAAGDCRTKKLRQVVTAVSDGAVAATMAEEYLSIH